MVEGVYKNSTELMNLHGVSLGMRDVADACLYGRLNLFLQGDRGSGKTQLAEDIRGEFGDKSLYILGRNDMDTRELFQQINPDFLRALREGSNESVKLRELTDAINYNLVVVDELPNCVPAVRAQLFNLFDGFVEIGGKAYPIGNGYSVGIAMGNIGQKFTESSNGLGAALKDRLHVTVDVDYYSPNSSDTLEILAGDTDPRVTFAENSPDSSERIINQYHALKQKPIPFDKLLIANYLLHGLDHCGGGSKRKMKDSWPVKVEDHEQCSDVGLILPLSVRSAKSVLRFSQALDDVALEKGAKEEDISSGGFNSMMQAYRFVASHSGFLNEAAVRNTYENNPYKAMDAVITTTTQQFRNKSRDIAAGLEMVARGKIDEHIMNRFEGRWAFMKDTLEGIKNAQDKSAEKD